MKRRLFISLLGGTAAWPLTARAQQTVGKFPKIGFLQGSQNENVAAFIQALQAAGYTDGQNVRIETRIYGTMLDRLGEFASELVDLQCKVILAAAPYAIRAAAGATAPASPSVAQINMSATPSAGRGRALKPRPADTRHRLVPNYRNPNSVDPNIGRLSGELAPFFTPHQHCGRTFNQRAALQQHPDIEARPVLDEAIERKVRVVIVAQAKTGQPWQ